MGRGVESSGAMAGTDPSPSRVFGRKTRAYTGNSLRIPLRARGDAHNVIGIDEMSKAKTEVERLTDKLAEVEADLTNARLALEAARAVTVLSQASAYLAGRGTASPEVDQAAQLVETIETARKLVVNELARAKHRENERAYVDRRDEHAGIVQRLCDALRTAKECLESEAELLREMRPFVPPAIAWHNHTPVFRGLAQYNPAKFERDQLAAGFKVD